MSHNIYGHTPDKSIENLELQVTMQFFDKWVSPSRLHADLCAI